MTPTVGIVGGGIEQIEPQFRFAVRRILPVAVEAISGQDGPHIAGVVDLLRRSGSA